MARLIETIDDLKKYLVVSANLDFKKIIPYADRAERKIIINLIGRDQYDTLVVDNSAAGSPVAEVKKLFAEASAHYALLLALPTINLQITNSGTKTIANTDAVAADWRDKLDLNRSLIRTYNEAIDDAFEIMEDNVDAFPEWVASKHYTIFSDLIVKETRIFDDFFSIQKSRQTFAALKPYMREVEEQYFVAMLGDATLQVIKSPSENAMIIRARELAEKAVVALSVAKVAETGVFSFSETSMAVASDSQPWEKRTELTDERLRALRKAKQTAGEEYLKRLKKIIVQNPGEFPEYTDRTETGLAQKIIVKKSHLFL